LTALYNIVLRLKHVACIVKSYFVVDDDGGVFETEQYSS